MIRITLPWPTKWLSPNARLHWTQKHKVHRAWRKIGAAETLAQGIRRNDFDIPQDLKVTLVFSPPDKRQRDLDNMLASCKPMLDGISDVIGIDDSKWQIALRREAPVKGGSVRIELEAA